MRHHIASLVTLAVTLLLLWGYSSADEDTVEITLLQMNDVYEIDSVSGGRYGGLARVQTVLKALRKDNPNTLAILPGDLLSPSAMGTAKVNGKRIAGAQMIAVLNAMGWDYATLGNHEFDLGEAALQARLDESQFVWFTNNVTSARTGEPFPNTQGTQILNIDGIKLAMVGLTLQALETDFVGITDPMTVARQEVKRLKEEEKVDVLLMVTHQSLDADVAMVEALPEIDLVMGGHEHENYFRMRGDDFTPIAKADANARSVYIHRVSVDRKTRQVRVASEIKIIDAAIADDPAVRRVVDEWTDKAFKAFEADGLKPRETVTVTTEELDGMEAVVRNGRSRLTEIMADSALHAFEGAEASLYNAGSIRIDDVIPAGVVTQYDVIRTLPFGGDYRLVSMPGDILKQALEVGLQNRGSGGFLQYAGINQKRDAGWQVNGQPLDTADSYKVSIAAFLIERGDQGLGFLVNNPRIKVLDERKAGAQQELIKELQRVYPPRS